MAVFQVSPKCFFLSVFRALFSCCFWCSCVCVYVFFFRQPVTFVKELIYRSLERHNLDKVYRQIQELRKRLRTREQKAVGPRAEPFV